MNPNNSLIHPDSIPVVESVDILLPQISSLANLTESEAIPMTLNLDWKKSYLVAMTDEDERKISSDLKKILEIYPVELSDSPTFQEILQLSIWAMWRLTGYHESDDRPSPPNRASELVDFENPPRTKCNHFNNAFILLFTAACKSLGRPELLDKFKMLMIRAAFTQDNGKYDAQTHSYIALLWDTADGVKAVAIDPYHTYHIRDSSPATLLKNVDFTKNRELDLLLGIIEFSGANRYSSPAYVAKVIDLLLQQKRLVKSEILKVLIERIVTANSYEKHEDESVEYYDKFLQTLDISNPDNTPIIKEYSGRIGAIKSRKAMIHNQIVFLQRLEHEISKEKGV